MWQGEAPGEYTCVNEPTRNSTGNNGDYNRYCIFDKEDDAKNFCNSDPTCKGYIANSANNMFSVTRKPVVNTDANGNFFIRNTAPAQLCWNTANAQKGQCMGGWQPNGDLCIDPAGSNKCSPYGLSGMATYTDDMLNTWVNQCGISNPPGCQ
jgi:hypothetical protein